MPKVDEVRRPVVKSALRIVPIKDLQVDPSYQRAAKRGHRRIAADFNEQALGLPLVAQREDGSLWIVDGQQRILALGKLGHDKARVEVFASQGPEHEAEVFKLVNLNRTKLTVSELFRALLTAQDERAWRIKTAVEAEGFTLVLGGGNAKAANPHLVLTCIATLQDMEKSAGVDGIHFALATIKECWPGDKGATNCGVVGGLSLFWKRLDGAIDTARMLPRLQSTTPYRLIYAARQTSASNNRVEAVATMLEHLYAKRKTPKPKI